MQRLKCHHISRLFFDTSSLVVSLLLFVLFVIVRPICFLSSTWLGLACSHLLGIIYRIYDGVEAEHETNNMKTSLRFSSRGLNTSIYYFSHTYFFFVISTVRKWCSYFFSVCPRKQKLQYAKKQFTNLFLRTL